MAEYNKRFTVQIITLTRCVGEMEAVYVSFPATDGSVGILADRAPLIAAVGDGPLIIRTPEGGTVQYFVSGGFVQVSSGTVALMPEHCQSADSLDLQAIEHQIESEGTRPSAMMKAKLKMARQMAGSGK